MRNPKTLWRAWAGGLAMLCLSQPCGAVPAEQVSWKKTLIEAKFRSEGVAVADVNRDGKMDVMVGDYWYQAPAWIRHEIRKPGDYGDGSNSYSKAFACFTDDVNQDGWSDLLVVGFPGEASLWYENPRNAAGHWKERVLATSACNETPIYVDLFGDGKKYLVMGSQPEGQILWFSPNADIDKPWDKHSISVPSTKEKPIFGTDRFSHGLGAGDINGDGRNDVLVRQGWWEQPADARTTTQPWVWHDAILGDDCADMFVFDVDGDKTPDVLSSSAHRKGIWWHQQTPGQAHGWKKHTIADEPSQTHALHFVDINGDGQRDLVTGKRYWAHGPTGDVDPTSPAVTCWFELVRENGEPRWVRHIIDENTGAGTQFSVADMNGDGALDVIVSNKKGVTLLQQVRR
ncbi:MAG: hypothetical protein JWN98_1859 [Abditibacteriota bacterium]|nr:hypothetical protein [Abditibacteriota bacterium]